ncbi:MAG: preprotein translocase subunit SecG [Planctomycetaceae bacterium]|nr:preprotein translocase subunit SecG [Planctomycetaceae bacterium]
MGVLFILIFLFLSILIVGLVLLQEGKGGGLTGMSAGMDGVMGAKNPLRRMTAYLFTFFVVMCLAINWYFYQRVDTSIPVGLPIPAAQRVVEENANAAAGPVVVEGDLRPEAPAAPETPAEPLRPADEAAPAAEPVAPPAPAAEAAPAADSEAIPEAAPAAE